MMSVKLNTIMEHFIIYYKAKLILIHKFGYTELEAVRLLPKLFEMQRVAGKLAKQTVGTCQSFGESCERLVKGISKTGEIIINSLKGMASYYIWHNLETEIDKLENELET